MEYRNLGRSGLKVSLFSFGSWLTFGKQIENSTAEELMSIAFENGVNFFDNAEAYARGKSEEVMGEILKKKDWPRTSYIVSSKVYFGSEKEKLPTQRGLNRKHVVEACHAALKRLQVDYLDLYFCHRPDPETPIEETVRTMHNLIEQGKVLYWGTSEWSAAQIMEAHRIADESNLIPPTMEQPQYNIFHRNRVELEYKDIFNSVGMGTTIWSPLASGLLTGKYNDSTPEDTRLHFSGFEWLKDYTLVQDKLEKVRKFSSLANDMGISPSQLALAWCTKNPNISTVILGASKPHQLKENLQTIEFLDKVDDEVLDKIEEIFENKPQLSVFN
ncbi:MAG: potassium channel beta subunit family protein [Flavobacteriales bacterium]